MRKKLDVTLLSQSRLVLNQSSELCPPRPPSPDSSSKTVRASHPARRSLGRPVFRLDIYLSTDISRCLPLIYEHRTTRISSDRLQAQMLEVPGAREAGAGWIKLLVFSAWASWGRNPTKTSCQSRCPCSHSSYQPCLLQGCFGVILESGT